MTAKLFKSHRKGKKARVEVSFVRNGNKGPAGGRSSGP
jgi:hypothetical protein